MLDTPDPQRTLRSHPRPARRPLKGFKSVSGLEQPVDVQSGAGELNEFTSRGYATAFAVLGMHRWLHTTEDTLERVNARLAAPVLRALEDDRVAVGRPDEKK